MNGVLLQENIQELQLGYEGFYLSVPFGLTDLVLCCENLKRTSEQKPRHGSQPPPPALLAITTL